MNKKLHELYGFRPQLYQGAGGKWADLFGVELELEDLSALPELADWVIKQDGSLRNGYEYILARPLGGAALLKAIDTFYKAGLKYTNGPRTSTHVHVTAGDMTVDNLRSMIILMYTIEDALFNVIGETRKWAGYAMPLREMEPARLRSILSSEDNEELFGAISPNRNQERYYGLNLCVRKHGTVEFRYFPGGPTRDELEGWIDLIHAVKRAAIGNSTESLLNIADGPESLLAFLRAVLPAAWYLRLLQMTTAEDLYTNYTEVTTLASGNESPRRRASVVFASKPLMAYLRKSLLKGAGGEYLEGIVDRIPVMSLVDWNDYFGKARNLERMDSKKKKVDAETQPDQPGEVWIHEYLPNAAQDFYPEPRQVDFAQVARRIVEQQRAAEQERQVRDRRAQVRVPRPADLYRAVPNVWEANPFQITTDEEGNY